MDEALFREEPVGLAERRSVGFEERLDYEEENNLLHVNLDGLSIDTGEDVDELAGLLDRELSDLDKKAHAVVNYGDFYPAPEAREAFFETLRHNEQNRFLSSTGYTRDAFLRRRLREESTEAGLEQRIYRDFDEARESLETTDL